MNPPYPPPRAETIHAIRSRHYPSNCDIGSLLGLLRIAHSTGILTLGINQGGVASIVFEERERIALDKD